MRLTRKTQRGTPKVQYLVCINLRPIPQETLVIISISHSFRSLSGGRGRLLSNFSLWHPGPGNENETRHGHRRRRVGPRRLSAISLALGLKKHVRCPCFLKTCESVEIKGRGRHAATLTHIKTRVSALGALNLHAWLLQFVYVLAEPEWVWQDQVKVSAWNRGQKGKQLPHNTRACLWVLTPEENNRFTIN